MTGHVTSTRMTDDAGVTLAYLEPAIIRVFSVVHTTLASPPCTLTLWCRCPPPCLQSLISRAHCSLLAGYGWCLACGSCLAAFCQNGRICHYPLVLTYLQAGWSPVMNGRAVAARKLDLPQPRWCRGTCTLVHKGYSARHRLAS